MATPALILLTGVRGQNFKGAFVMKALLAASAIVLTVAGSAMAQTTNNMPNNPAASDQPAARGLGSDQVQNGSNAPANNGSIDYGNTGTILPEGSVGGAPAPSANNNVGGDNQGTPTDTLPGNGSSGSSIGSGTIGSGGASGTGGGSSAY
jgi:hypothetical protein